MENNDRPIGKSNMAWMWWILGGLFIAIIVVVIIRFHQDDKIAEEAAIQDAKQAPGVVQDQVEQTAPELPASQQ